MDAMEGRLVLQTLTKALKAIIARIDGVWDDPDLMAYGPLNINAELDVKILARTALSISGYY